MRVIIFLTVLFTSTYSEASIDFGLGTSSFTYGRAVPSLNVSVESALWGLTYQSEGVQTPIYAQNAWTVSGYRIVQADKFSLGDLSIGAGLGASYIVRSYRSSLTAKEERVSEYVIGPYFCAKYEIGFFFIGFNTLLGITSQIQEHVLLNFQDMSHITLGITL